MPVTDKRPYVAYDASGADTYSFDFRVLTAEDLVVTVAGVAQVLGAQHEVTLLAAPAEGGSVVFQEGYIPEEGAGLVEVKRVMATARTIDYQEAGGFRQATVDKDFDGLLMMVQELKDQLRRLAESQTLVAADDSGRLFTIKVASGGPNDDGGEILYPEITPL